jgi:hypothetical protein
MPPEVLQIILDFHNNKETYKDSLGVQELAFITFDGFVF